MTSFAPTAILTRTALSVRYQRRVQWLLNGTLLSISFTLGMLFTLGRFSNLAMTAHTMLAPIVIGLWWLGSGLGNLLATIIIPQLRATRLLGGGTLLMAEAIAAWSIAPAPSALVLTSCGAGAGIGFALASCGANLLAQRMTITPNPSLTWIGYILGSLLGVGSMMQFSWRMALAGSAVPCLFVVWEALRLPEPPILHHIPRAWRTIWLPHDPTTAITNALVIGVQLAMLAGLALYLPSWLPEHLSRAHLVIGLVCALCIGVLWIGGWIANIITATTLPPRRWWRGGTCLVAALCWLMASMGTGPATSLGFVSAMFLLGLASPAATPAPSIASLPTLLIALVAGGMPWLISAIGTSLHLMPLLLLFALPLVIISGVLFCTPASQPTAHPYQPLMQTP